MSGSIHRLDVIPPYMDAIVDGSKPFEIRLNDRAFQTGDLVELVEVADYSGRALAVRTETGRMVLKSITYVYSGDPRFRQWGGLRRGWVVLGLGDPT